MTKETKGSLGVVRMSYCNTCKHNNFDGSCKAFEKIPRSFKYEKKHTKVIQGQLKPVIYEAKK